MKGILMIVACFCIVIRLTASYSMFDFDADDDGDDFEDEMDNDDVTDITNNLSCNYDTTAYTSVGSVYRCNLQNNINIISRGSAMMLSASGTHLENKSNGYVTAFSSTSSSQIINYIPMNLENIFPNLTSIYIDYGRIKELQQSDLRPYPKLMYLYLDNNDIEVLEDGLFDYNPQMVYIRIDDNKIFHIGAHVFHHLNKLVSLDLEDNKCISMYRTDNAIAVKEIISQTKIKCFNQEYVSIDDRLKTLEDNLVCANSETHPFFEQRLSSLKNQFHASKVSTFALLSRRFEALSTWKSKNIGTVLDKISTVEIAVTNSKSDMLTKMNSMKNDLETIRNTQASDDGKITKVVNDIQHSVTIQNNISQLIKLQAQTCSATTDNIVKVSQTLNKLGQELSIKTDSTEIKSGINSLKLDMTTKLSTIENDISKKFTNLNTYLIGTIEQEVKQLNKLQSQEYSTLTDKITKFELSSEISAMNSKISNLTSILQDFIQSSTRSSNQFQSELKDRLQITNYKIDKSSTIQDYSKSMLIGSCALLVTIVLVIIYKKILIRPDDLDY